MNTKRKLNCYVFSNLIVSILSLNMLTNNSSTILIKKEANNTLNKIYEKEIVETISTPDMVYSSEAVSNVVTISNKVMESGNNVSVSSYVKPSYNSLTGANLVNYAKQFVGLRYISAGTSLATGTDCSGFTSLIYKEFGVTLGRTVTSQLYSGTYVSREDLEPGDLVFYSYGNVTIYIGNGMIIHESNPRDGVKISSMNIMRYITARRIITSNVGTKVIDNNVNTNIQTKEEVTNNVPIENNIKEEVIEPEVKNEEIIVVDNNPVVETEVVPTDDNVSSNEEKVVEEIKEEPVVIEDTTNEEEIIEDNNN